MNGNPLEGLTGATMPLTLFLLHKRVTATSRSSIGGNKIRQTVLRTTRLSPFYYRTDRTSPRRKAAKEKYQGDPPRGGQSHHMITKLAFTILGRLLGAYLA